METSSTAPVSKSVREESSLRFYLSYLRSLLFTDPLIFLSTAVLATAALVGSLFDSRGEWQHGAARVWARLILKISGVSVRVAGLEHVNPAEAMIFCANHPSAMDIPILFANLPVQFRFLAKRELFMVPFLGWYMRRSGHIAVDRGRPREALKSFDQAAAKVKEGCPVLLFPEGSRSRTGKLLPFKSGTFYLAIRAGVPLVPITLNGTRYVHKPDTYHVRSGITEMVIHEPIPTANLKVANVAALSARVRQQILSRLVPAEAWRSRNAR